MSLLLGCSAQKYRRCSTSPLPSEVTVGFMYFQDKCWWGDNFWHIPEMQSFFILLSYSLKSVLLCKKGERPSNIREKQPSEAGLLLICLYSHSNLWAQLRLCKYSHSPAVSCLPKLLPVCSTWTGTGVGMVHPELPGTQEILEGSMFWV